MKIEVEKSNKGTTYAFSSTVGRVCRATLEIPSLHAAVWLTYNGDKWSSKAEPAGDVLKKLSCGEYAVCPRFTVATVTSAAKTGSTLIFRVKHPNGGKVRLYLQLEEGIPLRLNFSEKLTPEETMEYNKFFFVDAVDILLHDELYFISEITEAPVEEAAGF